MADKILSKAEMLAKRVLAKDKRAVRVHNKLIKSHNKEFGYDDELTDVKPLPQMLKVSDEKQWIYTNSHILLAVKDVEMQPGLFPVKDEFTVPDGFEYPNVDRLMQIQREVIHPSCVRMVVNPKELREIVYPLYKQSDDMVAKVWISQTDIKIETTDKYALAANDTISRTLKCETQASGNVAVGVDIEYLYFMLDFFKNIGEQEITVYSSSLFNPWVVEAGRAFFMMAPRRTAR